MRGKSSFPRCRVNILTITLYALERNPNTLRQSAKAVSYSKQPDTTAPSSKWIDPAMLGDIDAWDVRRYGDWLRFHARLPGAQGTREFVRRAEAVGDQAPEIIAAPSAALFGLLALGSARRADTWDGDLRFCYHVVTTGDELGPSGALGTEENTATNLLQRPTEQNLDTLLADEIIARRFETCAACR